YQAKSQQFRWAHALGNGIGNGVAYDNFQNCVVTGFFSGTVDFDPGPAVDTITSKGNYDIFVAKYDVNGNYMWAFGIGSNAYATSQAVSIDASGNIAITGWFQGTADFNPGPAVNNLNPHGYESLFLAKYDPNGNYLWAFSLGDTTATVQENGTSLSFDISGNILLTGAFQDTIDFDPGPAVHKLGADSFPDTYVAKYNANGNYLWAFKVGSPSGCIGYALSSDKNGNILVTGSFGNTTDFNPGPAVNNLTAKGLSDIFIAKYDAGGNYLWAFSIGANGGWSQAQTWSIASDTFGNVLATGYFGGNADFDPGSGVHMLSGGTESGFLAKYDANGNYKWAFKNSSGVGTSVAADIGSNILLTGGFKGVGNFNPSGTNNLTAIGNEDLFLARYDSSGNYVWAFNAGCSGKTNEGMSVSCDKNGNIWITGQLSSGNVDVDPGSAIYYLSAGSPQNSFIAKYNSKSMGIRQQNNEDNYMNAFPNPSDGNITIGINETNPGHLTVFNQTGEKVFETTVTNNYLKVNLPVSGVYQIVFTSSVGVSVKKIIIAK
ncbi:MAG TPA: T9SS type A sorting domain-containing protein, partial [Bacteroidia bacterium]|nr:T9SS type A sorting domain-containing protein [Bacteroidia bacterium]